MSFLVLGIDLGTTSVKVAVIDSENQQVLDVQSENTNADIVSDTSPLGSEQCHLKILEACTTCIQRLKDEHRKHIGRIAVSGQMHGVILWSSHLITAHQIDDCLDLSSYQDDNISPLYTWQDARCSEDFLTTLPQPDSHLNLATGHGCATLIWIKKNIPSFFGSNTNVRFDCAGTIMDMLTAILCGLVKPVMSVQNAASWGFYNTVTNSWNKQILQNTGFPINLLPNVIQPARKVGELKASWLGIPKGAGVGVAMGDLQCSILPHLISDTHAVVNVGTSMQAVFKCPSDFKPTRCSLPQALEYFPFFNGSYLTVAASLNGGNVLAATVKMFQQMMEAMQVPQEYFTDEKVITILMEKGKNVTKTDLKINPTIFGERHAMKKKGDVRNITPFNMNIGDLSRALCSGLMENLVDMLPREILCTAGITRIVGCGNALLKNEILQEELKRVYDLPVEMATDDVNAAVGSAIALAIFWHTSEK
ncbi:sedoheptulokinase-like [Antedon mediterranea]|uniref:sedoheptulokinase-like n=1 Tax=Antedon mediterranea TaxID=105859 RepID=UPI003AF90622